MKLVFSVVFRWRGPGGGSGRHGLLQVMVMERDDGRDPIFKVHFRSHKCDAWVAVNAYSSQPPMQGQAVANSKVKVTIYDHQPTAVHDTLARVVALIHSHSHNVAFQHLNGCFVRSEVTPHQRLFS